MLRAFDAGVARRPRRAAAATTEMNYRWKRHVVGDALLHRQRAHLVDDEEDRRAVAVRPTASRRGVVVVPAPGRANDFVPLSVTTLSL